MKRFNDYINESNTYLKIYSGGEYPYNYTVIKGDDLYGVSFRKGKPFLHKYYGKINPDAYQPVGSLIKNPSKPLIFNVQKLNGKKKINEEYDTSKGIPDADRLDFMLQLKNGAEEILKDYSKDFKIDFQPGKSLTISTGKDDDLYISIKFVGEKISLFANPLQGPEYEFAYSFDKNGLIAAIDFIKTAFTKSPNQGLSSKPTADKYKADTKEPSEDIKEEDIDPLDIPIKLKPKRRVRSININIIQDVLEDAYILDDIDLKDTDVTELVRRMLLETRRKSKK